MSKSVGFGSSPFTESRKKPKDNGPKPLNRCACGGFFAFDTHPVTEEKVCPGCYAEACADAFERAARADKEAPPGSP